MKGFINIFSPPTSPPEPPNRPPQPPGLVRFFPEEKNDKKFARHLATLAQIYVNDAFASSHRDHASVSAIKRYLPAFTFSIFQDFKLSKVLVTYLGFFL